jgi:hypothetical protein
MGLKLWPSVIPSYAEPWEYGEGHPLQAGGGSAAAGWRGLDRARRSARPQDPSPDSPDPPTDSPDPSPDSLDPSPDSPAPSPDSPAPSPDLPDPCLTRGTV